MKPIEALNLLHDADHLLDFGFWAADFSHDERGQAIAYTIMAAQDKIEAAMALLSGEAKPGPGVA